MTTILSTSPIAPVPLRIRAVPATAVLVGHPRCGSTMVCALLGRQPAWLTLSEPFLAHAVAPDWKLRRFFLALARKRNLRRRPPPRRERAVKFHHYLQALVCDNRLDRLVLKETFRASPPHADWHNVEQLDWLTGENAAVAALVRDPRATAASTLRLCRWVIGWSGRAIALRWPATPVFRSADHVVEWSASNWVKYVEWTERRALPVTRYEDFVAEPAVGLARLCERLRLPFEHDVLLDPDRPTLFWGMGDPEVVRRPPRLVHRDAVPRGRQLTPRHAEIVRRICAPVAERFGYAL